MARMSKAGNRKLIVCIIAAAFLLLLTAGCFGLSALKSAHAEDVSGHIITGNRKDLADAVDAAAPGDTILVGNIDFNYPAVNFNEFERIAVNKSITIKSGLNGKAVFTGGSFIIDAPLNESGKITCRFENILFDGQVDITTLTDADWYPDGENHYSDVSKKAQYAATFRGWADVYFSGCGFTGYMNRSGGALWCEYGLTDEPSAPDYRFCKLNVNLSGCNFTANSAYYTGGAVYMFGYNNNVALNMVDCDFSGNVCNSIGGGGVYAAAIRMSATRCSFTNNKANYLYKDDPPFTDFAHGGAVYCTFATLELLDCTLTGNEACNGGGLSLTDTKAVIDGCIIADNVADTESIISNGEWSRMGIGGGAFIQTSGTNSVTFINTSIYENWARNSYGGIYIDYEEWNEPEEGFGKVSFYFCSYADNSGGDGLYTGGTMWASDPADTWALPCVSAFGCIIIDEFYSESPKYALPSGENGYNYFALPGEATSDDILAERLPQNSGYGHLYSSDTQNVNINIPAAAVPSALSGRLIGTAQTLLLGSNYNSGVTILINAAGAEIDGAAFGISYGQTLDLPTPLRGGYTFGGWFTDDGIAFNISGNLFPCGVYVYTLTAKWTANSYEVTFISDGEVCAVKSQTFDKQWDLATAPVKDGYEFAGWYTGRGGTGQRISQGDIYGADGGLTLYAHYIKIFPAWAIVLIAVGAGLSLLAVGTVFVLRRKKLAYNAAGLAAASDGDFVPVNGNLDRLSETYNLTPREKEIAALIVEGKSQMTMAGELFISVDTVKTHTRHLYEKLEINSRYELFAKLKKA